MYIETLYVIFAQKEVVGNFDINPAYAPGHKLVRQVFYTLTYHHDCIHCCTAESSKLNTSVPQPAAAESTDNSSLLQLLLTSPISTSKLV